MIPADIRTAFDIADSTLVKTISSGGIHETYEVGEGVDRVIVQRVRIFPSECISDMQAVTKHLAFKGLLAPELLKTTEGADGTWWRSMTYISGTTVEHTDDPELLARAAALVGKFHVALLDFQHEFAFSLPHFHDTVYVMEKLQTVLQTDTTGKAERCKEHGAFIVGEYKKITPFSSLPKRIIHGDLKLANVRFGESAEDDALIDLDTVMEHSIPVELGDAFRSWCATGDESTSEIVFNMDSYKTALDAYLAHAPFITDAEREAIPLGVKLITLELAARFLTDSVEESYFAHRKDKWPTLSEQNFARAKNQLALYASERSLL